LAGAIEAAELGAEGARLRGARAQASDVTRGERVREAIAIAVLAAGSVQEAYALEEVRAELLTGRGVHSLTIEGEQDELVDLGLKLELEQSRGQAGADALGHVKEVTDAFEGLEERVGIGVVACTLLGE